MDEAAPPLTAGGTGHPRPGERELWEDPTLSDRKREWSPPAPVCNSELDNPTRKEPQRLEGLLQLPKQQAPSRSPMDPLPAPEPPLSPEAACAGGRRT